MAKKEKVEKSPRQVLFEKLSGRWEGKITTWMEPGTPPVEGKIAGKVELAAGGSTLMHSYRAKAGKGGHRGLMLVGEDIDHHKVTGSWTDTGHTGGNLLNFVADDVAVENGLSVKGYWTWGDARWAWRVTHQLVKKNRLEIRHFIVLPDGQEKPAIRIEYKRAGA